MFAGLSDVVVTKQCNADLRLEVGKPVRLLEPSAKSLTAPVTQPGPVHHNLEHFLCYQAKLAKKLIAQSGCGAANPLDQGTTLVPAQPQHAPLSGLYVANQFAAERLDTVKEAELCIPSQIVP